MYRYRMEYLKEPGTHKLLLKEHEAIYSALKKHDKAEAGSAIRIPYRKPETFDHQQPSRCGKNHRTGIKKNW